MDQANMGHDKAARYVFWVRIDVEPAFEALLHEVYQDEHVPALLAVPGVRTITRYTSEPGEVIVGGKAIALPSDDIPKHHTLYELDSPDVLRSAEWRAAVDAGRWPTAVRPHLTRRAHALLRMVESAAK